MACGPGHDAHPGCPAPPADPGQDRALAPDAQEPHPARALLPTWRSRGTERTFNAGVFDDTGSTLASEEKIAEHRAAGENLLELSDHGFIRILFTSSAGFVNVERITPKGREYLARYGDRLSLDQARTSHHDPARWWRGGSQTLAISFRGPERLEPESTQLPFRRTRCHEPT
jgi:hypothetical protein